MGWALYWAGVLWVGLALFWAGPVVRNGYCAGRVLWVEVGTVLGGSCGQGCALCWEGSKSKGGHCVGLGKEYQGQELGHYLIMKLVWFCFSF